MNLAVALRKATISLCATLFMCGLGMSQPAETTLSELVAQLVGARAKAETCIALLKEYGDSAQIEHGRVVYAKAKAASDAVIAGLLNDHTSLFGVQADLRTAVLNLAEFCDFVGELLPKSFEYKKDPQIENEARKEIEKKLSELGDPSTQDENRENSLLKIVSDWLAALYNQFRTEQSSTRASEGSVLEASKWPDFPSNIASLVQQQISLITPGIIVFNPPSEMVVGTPEQITIRVTRDVAEDIVKKGLQGRGIPKLEQIEVGTFMRARLWGDGFDIRTQSDEGQVVPTGRFAEWVFRVLPLESGTKTLNLFVAIRLKLLNGEEILNLPALAREITVHVNPWWSVNQFAANNWQWFVGGLGTIFMGVGSYLGKRWFERKYGKSKPEYS
jgi:hypothetical protein